MPQILVNYKSKFQHLDNIYDKNNFGKSSLALAEFLAKEDAATKENHEILKLVQKKHKELKDTFNQAAQTTTMTINKTMKQKNIFYPALKQH